MKRGEVWIVRHGETEWSKSGKHTGRTDIPLSEAGRAITTKLRPVLANHRFARVFSSPLVRARTTCELAGLGAAMELRDDLMEWDYGAYEGRTTPEIRADSPSWSLWTDGAPGGESPMQVGARADRVIGELRSIEGDVAVFAHGHLLRVLAARWIGLEPAAGRLFVLGTATISRMGYERDQAAFVTWNESAHLEGP
jgi:broad specificity phosphatase PhoE